MNRRSLAIIVVTLLTLGSGWLNLYSVIEPSMPARVEVLRRIFPLEFVHLSRSATMVTGFALVISSLNIYRRKRLAWWLAVSLAVLSIVFHMVKGVDYEEATLSAALLAVLYATRSNFTVRSRGINWLGALQRTGLALGLVLVYGAAGFWLFEPRQFGQNFNWQQALTHTIRFLFLQGDPSLAPHTRHAEWFVDSLYLITATAFLYSGYAVFRPVLYRFRTHPQEVEQARRILAAHGRSGHDFFKARPDKSFFFSKALDGFLAYRVGGNFALVLGDPVGPEEEIEEMTSDFTAYCKDNGWGVGFHQVTADFLCVYQRLGFRKLKVGDEAIVDLNQFTLEGKSGKPFRSKVNQLERDGIRVVYSKPPLSPALMSQLREVSDEWLQIQGRRERQFTLGMFDEEYLSATPVLTASDATGKILAFVNIIPSYRKGEATVDLMRRRTDAPNGIMDYVFVKLFLLKKDQGFDRFNLGMVPMAGFQPQEEASPEERAIHVLMQRLTFLFSFKGLLSYKSKFATAWEPRYAIYGAPLDLPRLAFALTRVSEPPD